VDDLDPFVEQDFRDQQTSMAELRVLLAAHDRESKAAYASLQPRKAGAEGLGRGNPTVEHVTVVVIEARIVRSTTEGVTEEEVLRPRSVDDFRKARAIRPSDVTRMRPRPNVDQHLDPGGAHELREMLRSVVRVAQGNESGRRFRRHRNASPTVASRIV
jgi:hypothetical protein